MKPNTYRVLQEAVETGIAFGLGRSFKHSESPSRDFLHDNLEREIMNAICEWFIFDEVKDDSN